MGLFSRKDKKSAVDSAKGPGSDAGSVHRPTNKPTNGNTVNASLSHVPLPRAPDPALNPAAYLRSIYAVRERSKYVFELAKRGKSKHFDVDMTKFADTARFVVSIVNVSCPMLHNKSGKKRYAEPQSNVLPIERLCSRLRFDPPTWPLAAL
jgi:hypothetical protein